METTKKDFYENYCKNTKDGLFTPIYKYEHYNIEKEMYINLIITKTAEEVYKEWLESKDKEPDKTKISPTNDELKEENERLWETVEFLLKQVNMIPKEVAANE